MPFETLKTAQIRGILPTPPADACTISRAEPPAALRPYVSWSWTARWQLGDATHEQRTLPYPCANLVADDEGIFLYGPTSTCFSKHLTGTGHAVGIKFLPGGVRPLLDGPVADITDRRLPVADLLADQHLAASISCLASAPPGQLLVGLQGLLADTLSGSRADEPDDGSGYGSADAPSEPSTRPEPADVYPSDSPSTDPKIELAGRAVAVISTNRQITQVNQVASAVSMSRRSLQRLFTDYIGLGVKATIKRYRMQEAAEVALSGTPVDWATLATDLGYYDQSHFVGVFTATFGTSPRDLASDSYSNGAKMRN